MSTTNTDNRQQWIMEEDAKRGTRAAFRIKETLYHGKSEFQTIDIVSHETYGRMLFLDHMMMTTEADEFIYHEMITHIPLLAHPNPKRVLVIGGGDGGTVRETLKHPSVEEVILCEIDGQVIDVCKQYLPTIACKLDDPRVRIHVADGVKHMAALAKETLLKQAHNPDNHDAYGFDVIQIDSTDPVGPGEVLFTQSFYQDAFSALAPNGILVNQTESPFAHPDEIRMIYERLNTVFPLVTPYIATVPTYPGGYWSWAFSAKQNNQHPLSTFHTTETQQRAAAIEQTTQFYNREIHQAIFALPNFVKQRLAGLYTPAPYTPAPARSTF